MESGQLISKNTKVEIATEAENNIMSANKLQVITTTTCASAMPQLARQQSITKNNCLCSPTSHAGSFRCRLHRTPVLHRTKSIDSASPSKVNAVADHVTQE
ncbi:hypothetical protein JCGZ_17854 [Jatropha curcas]|uniref:Uncharacterized protein n=2 Tax=Jatropha curcas TaxID=180498 RepID=A0A067JRW6_JATCU|nr:hypothetical protein JCGZ_17854 [Jatropha curcas]